MKTYYRYGKYTCHAYSKQVGHGYEVGFYFGKHQVFVGNFIHRQEATKWWSMLNKEVKTFTRRYKVGPEASFAWYSKFFSRHLYKCYYAWLDQQFGKYQRNFDKACRQDVRKYQTFKKRWTNKSEPYYLKKAA
jgi:hypothetical protein